MATSDGDSRSSGKVARPQGKNISKLMRLFDSFDRNNSGHPPSPNVVENMTKATTSSGVPENQRLCDSSSSSCAPKSGVNNNNNINNVETVIKDSNVVPTEDSLRSKTNIMNCSDFQTRNSTSEIPYCRKVSNTGLWDNVDIGARDNEGLWNTAQNYDPIGVKEQVCNSLVTSTAELHSLIAVSKAELLKTKEPCVSNRSNLENYFTSFDSLEPGGFFASNHSLPNGFFNSDTLPSPYDCDINTMNFEDEEAMLSDTSSEEDLRCHPAMTNTNYLPAYALHTIIEESCEESERDSRTVTPTNNVMASKLERYFSWDMINDIDAIKRRKGDDESTIYSDSLSENSGSVDDDVKEIDPSHLASSRLEKYFTSGLLDDQNYSYPDDAEFLDDAPISDFEEDSVHQKISRSALLSALEIEPISSNEEKVSSEPRNVDSQECGETLNSDEIEQKNSSDKDVKQNAKFDSTCDTTDSFSKANLDSKTEKSLEGCVQHTENSEEFSSPSRINEDFSVTFKNDAKLNESDSKDIVSETSPPSDKIIPTEVILSEDNTPDTKPNDLTFKNNESRMQKPSMNKDRLAVDIQAIIRKLLSYFTDTESDCLKTNIESDYISAWQLLEREIETLLQSISPRENNSCNSSTIDSNNSDYGSDTIESLDCMTDEDENIEARSRSNAKNNCADNLIPAYKNHSEPVLSDINISEETLNIWKRLIQSLQKDNSVLSQNEVCDPTAEARLYIRDQIVTLMHTVTINDSLSEALQKNILKTNDAVNQNFDNPTNLCTNDEEEDCHRSITIKDSPINEAINTSFAEMDISSNLSNSVSLIQTDFVSEVDSSGEGTLGNVTEDISDNRILEASKSDCDVNVETYTPTSLLVDKDINEIVHEHSKIFKTMSDIDRTHAKPSIKTKRIEHDHKATLREVPSKDNDKKFSVIVDIKLDDNATNCELSDQNIASNLTFLTSSTLENSSTGEHCSEAESDIFLKSDHSIFLNKELNESQNPGRSQRDTGYYSFKSSDDSLLNTSSVSAEYVDVPNFKSLKRSIKKFPMSNALSKSTNNILSTFSTADKFSTLQLKSKKSKSSANASGSSSKPFSSLFSPSSVLKRITGSKCTETPTPESSIPAKYLKKYARSVSADNESLFGAASMPHLNNPKPGDSYSALGLYPENDRDSSLTLNEESDGKRYFPGSHSVLSLGAHSASMNSVYSGAGCHYGYVTVSGDVLFGLNYNQKSQVMEVFVKQCRNLAASDLKNNKSNPYVKVYLLPDKTRKRKTKTKKNTLDPVFNELLRFPVAKSELESRTLWLSVWNSDPFGRNDFLGEISLPLGYRLLDSPTLRWYPLQERVESLTSPLNYKGELFIALKYVPRDLSLESRFRPAPVISLRGALHVLVKEARNISANRSSATVDAFCKSYLLPDKSKSSKQKTPTVKKSGHPKWYYTVIYEDLSVDELRERSLELTVWDHDIVTSNEFMGGVRLNSGSGLYHGIAVDWMDSRRDESSLWHAMLESPNMWVDGCLPLRPNMQFQHS